MEETKFIWMDGKLIDWKEAKVHVLTHSLHYGGAVFEGIRFYKTAKGPAVFRLKEHLERLFHSASVFGMDVAFSKEEITDAIAATIKANGLEEGYIRPIIFYGYGTMGVSPKGAPVQVAIAVWPWGAYLGEKPVKVKISSFVKTHPKSTDPYAKITGNYQNSMLAGEEVKKQGYDEALLLDYQGNIAEGPGENIFLVKRGKLLTPRLGNVLPGITRDTIMTIAKDEGIPVKERDLRVEDVYEADEVFFTGTAAEVTSIASVDDKKIGEAPGEITQKLRELYLAVVHGKQENYIDWLRFVT